MVQLMGIPVLIIGRSGNGKSASLRNFKQGEIGIINVLGKPLPFKNDLNPFVTDDYKTVMAALSKANSKSIAIDDAGYLITNMFMRGHSSKGKGGDIFSFYNDIGDYFWSLIRFISEKLDPDKIVYLLMHEDKNDYGDIKPKTIGKMLDEKVCVEGLFTIALRAAKSNGKYIFYTQQTDLDVSKSPIGMFDDIEIDNDLKVVDKKIREYYFGGNEDGTN